MKRSFFLTVLIIAALFTGLTSFAPRQLPGLVEDILKHTNKFRKSHRLDELIMKSDLNSIAQKHSENMAKGRTGFGHTGFNQRFAQARKSIHGVHTFGENVAYGVSSGKSVVNMWSKSPPHRKNLLGKYRYIGIGVAKDRRGRLYYTQVFAN